MTRLFSFVGPLLRYVAGAADKNPKTNATITSMIVLIAGAFGVPPEAISAVGAAIVKIGQLLGG